MPRNNKKSSSNKNQVAINNKLKDKPTYKIIILGSGGVGKVSLVIKQTNTRSTLNIHMS